jgi:heme exporter protein C
VYLSVNIWRTVHPKTSVIPELSTTMPEAVPPLLVSMLAFVMLFGLLLMLRVNLAQCQDALDDLYLAHED